MPSSNLFTRTDWRAFVATQGQKLLMIAAAFLLALAGAYLARVSAPLVALVIGMAVPIVLMAKFRNKFGGGHHLKTFAPVMIALMMIMAIQTVSYAQSVTIDFSADDLAVFFDWFNMIFTALLPIALLGAGLTAGGLFVWVIAGMLIRAFQSMLGRGRTA